MTGPYSAVDMGRQVQSGQPAFSASSGFPSAHSKVTGLGWAVGRDLARRRWSVARQDAHGRIGPNLADTGHRTTAPPPNVAIPVDFGVVAW